MSEIYTRGDYLTTNRTWHAEDSPWKASQILGILKSNEIRPRSVAEIGCGAGSILQELSTSDHLRQARFSGYDISPQAIDLSKPKEHERLAFHCADLLAEPDGLHFDLLLAIDVFEHVPDYLGFLSRCRSRADYVAYHIPLEIHVSSVIRHSFLAGRYTVGHLHYFTAESAIAALRDTGHDIIDVRYTNAAIDLVRVHRSIKTRIANGPRWLVSRFSVPMAARLFGGYSLLVLTK